MKLSQRVLGGLVLLMLFGVPTTLLAKNGKSDRVQFFQNINVTADEQAGDLVCILCSIRVSGTTAGDTVAILGSVLVDGTAGGDVVAVGGGIKLGEDATIAGDAVGIGGGVVRHPNAVVKGELVSQSGPVVLLGLFVALVVVPLLPIILIVWLIVWLVRRDRPAPQTAYRH